MKEVQDWRVFKNELSDSFEKLFPNRMLGFVISDDRSIGVNGSIARRTQKKRIYLLGFLSAYGNYKNNPEGREDSITEMKNWFDTNKVDYEFKIEKNKGVKGKKSFDVWTIGFYIDYNTYTRVLPKLVKMEFDPARFERV